MVLLSLTYYAIRHFRVVSDSWVYILDLNGHVLHGWAIDPADRD